MATITFTGLESGFDSGALIDQMVAAEKIPEQAINNQKAATNQQISTLGSLVSGLQAIGTLTTGILAPGGSQALTATSSNTGSVTVSTDGTAAAGGYQVTVSSLAQAQTNLSAGFDSDTAGVAGVGSLSITVGTNPAVTVNYGASDTLDTIATALNQQSGGHYTASVLYDGTKWRIVINAGGSGTANALSFSSTGSSLGMTTVQPAADADVLINGIHVKRSTNSISDVIPGLTFNLQSVTPPGGAATLVTVAQDQSGLQSKVQAIVDAYNNVTQQINAQLAYNGSRRGPETLFGDPALQRLQGDLGNALAQSYSFTGGQLSSVDLGISLNNDGTLSFDTAKFASALASDPSAVQHLLVGDGKAGLASALASVVTNYSDATNGVLTLEQNAKTSSLDGYDKQIQAIEDRATAVGDSLRLQFANLDKIMTDFKTQQSYITAMTAQNNANNG